MPNQTIPCTECGGTGKVLNPTVVGQQMTALRMKANLTQKQVADRLGFTPSYICDLESGNRRWSKMMIEAYEKAVKK